MSAWVHFHQLGWTPSGKTKRWEVRGNKSQATLGEIRWQASWRKYVFFPDRDTLFDDECLRHIAEFIETENTLHKRGRPMTCPAEPGRGEPR